ncbi:MAG TPA: DbpA RNA binding domain-containing protein [Gemmatimonadales bacterium]
MHLTPPTAAALQRLGWTADDPGAREAAPTAARGHNLVAFTPPVPAYAAPALAGLLSRLGEGRRALLLAPAGQLEEWGALAHELGRDAGLRAQVAHGTARAQRRLKAGAVDLLIASPETALTLLRRSALPIDSLAAVFLAWPENWDEDDSLTPLMQDIPKDTQRLIYTSSPGQVEALVERYARKALTVGPQLEGDVAGAVRTVSVPWTRRVPALADLVELLDPASLVVWTADRSQHGAIARALGMGEPDLRIVTGDAPDAATIIAFDLPSRERLRQLVGAGEVVLLVPPGTEAYAARTAEPRRPLQLPGLVDDVANAAAAQRAAIVSAIQTGTPDRAILTLAPLFERHDAAAVAAALYQLWTAAGPAAAPAMPDIPATAKIYVGIGKKDGATANDLVAVLTKELRVEKGKIGRIELRDAYSLIEIPAQDAEKIATGLNGSTVRRKRVTARVDRGPTRGRAGGRTEARAGGR